MPLNKETILNVIGEVCSEYEIYEHRDQLSVIVPKDKIVETALLVRDNPDTSFELLIDVTAIDWLKKKESRFEVVYILYSIKHSARLRLKVPISEKDIHCPTVTGVWEAANWYERETYDMYGIIFDGHPGLRRFYMPEDYVDPDSGEPIFPLRKDFPLMGVPDSLPLPPYPEKYGELI
ncbi:MAG: NADH-quinone oxidoreductase subunit C [Candidatus Kapabacteria bacterium]|nr:NADH-quinone oxidoreductase subunit C [Ignavibacteriota bacterium]MCW5886241.1 NADH-quinone oxidoreductase subunit C [Candidatus Kapabacteria bacterium]